VNLATGTATKSGSSLSDTLVGIQVAEITDEFAGTLLQRSYWGSSRAKSLGQERTFMRKIIDLEFPYRKIADLGSARYLDKPVEVIRCCGGGRAEECG
jgi:hypothetical protein